MRRFLQHNRLGHDALLLLTLQSVYRLSGVILLVVLSRRLPASDIGLYFFALSFAESFMVLASFALNPVVMRRVATDPTQASAHLSPLLGFRLVSGPLYLLCISGAAVAFTGAAWRVIVVVALFALLDNTYLAFGNFFLALRKAHYYVGIGVTVEVLFVGVFLLGMWWTPSLKVLLAATLLRSVCLVGMAVFATHRGLCPLQVSWDSSFIKEGAPFLLLALLAMLRGKVDTLLLGFLTDFDTVGHYQLALRVVVTSAFVPTTVGLVLFPQFSAHGLTRENRRTLLCGTGLLLGLGLLGLGVISLGAAPLTAVLYGSLAEAITPLLRLLALLFPVNFLLLFLSSTLQALHRETKTLAALAVSTGVGFLAACVLTPLFGADGAAYARVVSALLQLGLLARHLWPLVMQPAPLTARQQGRGTLALPAVGGE